MSDHHPSVTLHFWEWRDGSIHPEIRLAHFAGEDGEVLTHLDGNHLKFESACGLGYFGRASGVGLGNPGKIDCPQCRSFLKGITLRVELRDPTHH